MSTFNNYQSVNFSCIVNGRLIQDWGEEEMPFKSRPIRNKNGIKLGQGNGNGAKFGAQSAGREVELYLNPSGADSQFMNGLLSSGATVELGYMQIGSAETAVGLKGVVVTDGEDGRGGATSPTDTVYTLQFADWNGIK